MSYETISVDPVTPRIGAVVSGVDLSQPVSNQQYSEIHDVLMAHQVIFFRDQDMTLEQHKDLGRHFGELHIHPASPGPEGHPEVLIIHADKDSKRIAGERWHSDVSCDPEPPMGSILHLHTIPPSGGDTLFASMYAAYEALSDRMKAYLEGLTATHSGEQVYRGRYADKGVNDAGKVYPTNVHPVVRTHPETGRKGLFVNRSYTQNFEGMTREESLPWLNFLEAHATRPELTCRFRWEKGSVAVWDNRCVMHIAMHDYKGQWRKMHRVQMVGDTPR